MQLMTFVATTLTVELLPPQHHSLPIKDYTKAGQEVFCSVTTNQKIPVLLKLNL